MILNKTEKKDRDRQTLITTNRNNQKGTKNYRKGQKRIETDRNKQKQTEKDRMGQKGRASALWANFFGEEIKYRSFALFR